MKKNLIMLEYSDFFYSIEYYAIIIHSIIISPGTHPGIHPSPTPSCKAFSHLPLSLTSHHFLMKEADPFFLPRNTHRIRPSLSFHFLLIFLQLIL